MYDVALTLANEPHTTVPDYPHCNVHAAQFGVVAEVVRGSHSQLNIDKQKMR